MSCIFKSGGCITCLMRPVLIALWGMLAWILFEIGPTCQQTLSLLAVILGIMMMYCGEVAGVEAAAAASSSRDGQESPRTMLVRKQIEATKWRLLFNKSHAFARAQVKESLHAQTHCAKRVAMIKSKSDTRISESRADFTQMRRPSSTPLF